MPPKPLANRTAIVTGASSGIGRAIAEQLGAAGAHVFLAGRTQRAMESSQKRIQEAGGQATVLAVDVRDPAQVQDLVDSAVRDTGRLDIMVNNAGVSYPAPIAEGDPEQWRTMLETNVLGLLVGCQAAVRAMRACKAEGHIVNISSIAAQRRDSGVYGSTKHAVNCISATLRWRGSTSR
jgi:NADP-dependent 3-hydroxy acid dehydrogenase YdfG